MAITNSTVKRIFGGPADLRGRHQADSTSQRVAEPLAVGVTARKFKGPKSNGHMSIMTRVATASGATSTMTFWYSNLPDPDETSDADWSLDTSLTSIDLTATGNTFYNAGNVNAEWVRVKVTTVTTAGTIWQFTRVEGVDNK